MSETAITRKYRFSGHQTFVFRHGWLEKGVRAVKECPTVFSAEDALIRLGCISSAKMAQLSLWRK